MPAAGGKSGGNGLPGLVIARLAGRRHHGGIMALADQVVASGTNFLTGIVMARSCSQEEFGLYMLCFSIIVFSLDLQTALISSPYLVYSRRLPRGERAAYLGNTMIQQFFLVVIMVALLVAAMIVTGYTSVVKAIPADRLAAVLPVLALVVWPLLLREFIRRVCFAALQMTTALLLDGTVFLGQLTGLLLLAAAGRLSTNTALYCIGLACVPACGGWLWSRRHTYGFSPALLGRDLRRNLSFGKWVFFSGLLWAASMTLYPWLLAFFHGTAATGVWGACWGVVAVTNPLLLGIQNYLGPKIIRAYTRGGRRGLGSYVVRAALGCGFMLLPLAVLLLFFGGRAVALLYGGEYGGHAPVVMLLAVYILISAITFPVSRGLLAMERARLYFAANLVPLAVMLGGGILLVKFFGAAGVAMALVAGSLATAVVMSGLFFSLVGKCEAQVENPASRQRDRRAP